MGFKVKSKHRSIHTRTKALCLSAIIQIGHSAVFVLCQVAVENDMTVSESETFNRFIHDSIGGGIEGSSHPFQCG
jgi:hypothetical protein